MERTKPTLWSDIDGTAVEIAGAGSWRGVIKYNLAGLEGYGAFLDGVLQGDVEFGGFTSKRPNIWLRRLATARFIAKLGLGENTFQTVLAGREKRKAQVIARASEYGPVAMLEDRPHKFGAALLKAMIANTAPEGANVARREVLLGVVHHNKSQRYTERLIERVATMNELELSEDEESTYISGDDFGVRVVMLPPYTKQAGEMFASKLAELGTAG